MEHDPVFSGLDTFLIAVAAWVAGILIGMGISTLV
jgi:hypothetical protein